MDRPRDAAVLFAAGLLIAISDVRSLDDLLLDPSDPRMLVAAVAVRQE